MQDFLTPRLINPLFPGRTGRRAMITASACGMAGLSLGKIVGEQPTSLNGKARSTILFFSAAVLLTSICGT